MHRLSNRAGGLEGGITNGEPVVIRAALKPLSTTLTPLRSIDLATGKAALAEYQRSDLVHIPRACVIGEAMVAWVLADALMEKIGGDSLREMRAHFESWDPSLPPIGKGKRENPSLPPLRKGGEGGEWIGAISSSPASWARAKLASGAWWRSG